MVKVTDFSLKKQGIQKNFTQDSECGSVIIWIFLMISLFAALNYAVSYGSRSSGSAISKEKASLAAQDILDYGRTLKETVQKLQINGCSDTQISFETPPSANYTNLNSPSDYSCHVFHQSGGGMKDTLVPEDIRVTGLSYPLYVANTVFQHMGSSNSGLHMWVRTINRDACIAYNKLVEIDTVGGDAPVENGFQAGPLFDGTYTTVTTFGDDNDGTVFNSHATGCHKDLSETDGDGNPYYDYYYILIVR